MEQQLQSEYHTDYHDQFKIENHTRMDLLSHKIITGLRSNYSNFSTYQDCGISETTFNPGTNKQWISKTLFRTIFKKPNFFRFDRRFRLRRMATLSDINLVVWFDGKNGFTSNSDKIEKIFGHLSSFHSQEDIIDRCISDCFVFVGPISGFVHPLFFEHLKGKSKLEKGEWQSKVNPDCYTLQSNNVSVNISKDPFLIKEINEPRTTDSKVNCYTRTSIIELQTNIEIEDSIFDKKLITTEFKNNKILETFKNNVGPLCLFPESDHTM